MVASKLTSTNDVERGNDHDRESERTGTGEVDLLHLPPALLNERAYMLCEIPPTSSDSPWQGYEDDGGSQFIVCDNCGRPMEGVASVLAILGAGTQGVRVTQKVHKNYRDAPQQISRAQLQCQQHQVNQKLLTKLPLSTKKHIEPAEALLNDLRLNSSTTLQPRRKRDRLKWSLGGKTKVEREITQVQRAENALNLSLLLSHCEDE